MQTNPINAAHLLMEYLDKEKAQIGHGIVTSEFSRELKIQQQQLELDRPRDLSFARETSGDEENLREALPEKPVSARVDDSSGQQDEGRARTLKRMVSSSERPAKSSDQTREDLIFTNPALIEKTLAELKVPAGVRKGCMNAEDIQGCLSLQGLIQSLNELVGSQGTPPEGKVTAQDIRNLMNSLTKGQSKAPINLEALLTRPDGVYSFDEFRQILDQAGQQAASAEAKKNAFLSQITHETPMGIIAKGEGDKPPGSPTKEQPQSQLTSIIPSFLGEDHSEGTDKKAIDIFRLPPGTEKSESGGNTASTTTVLNGKESQTGTAVEVKNLATRNVVEGITPGSARTSTPSEAFQVAPQGTSTNRTETAPAGIVMASMQLSEARGLKTAGNDSVTAEASSSYSQGLSTSYAGELGGGSAQESNSSFAQDGKNPKEQTFSFSRIEGGIGNSQVSDSKGQTFHTVTNLLQNAPLTQSGSEYNASGRLSMRYPSWPQDLAQRMQDVLQQRRTAQLTLELEPNELGRLTLRIGTKQEEVTAWVSTEKEQVRDLLLRNSPLLRQHLEEQGLTLGQFQVDVREEQNGGQHAQPDNPMRQKSPAPERAQIREQNDRPESLGKNYMKRPGDQLISLFA